MKILWKHKKTPSLLGVDTSHGSVKITELTKKGGSFFVTSCIKISYSKESEITAALRQGLNDIDGHGKNTAIALPDTSALIQKTLLDARLNEDEISIYVHDEASKYFNIPIDQLCLDFQIVSPLYRDEIKPKQKKCVYWVAVKKSLLDIHTQPIMQAGLSVKIIEIVSLSLQRVYSAILPKDVLRHQTILIAHFYETELLLIALKNDECLYATTATFGDETHLETLKNTLNVFYASSQRELFPTIYLSCDPIFFDEITKNMREPITRIDISPLFINIAETCIAKKYSLFEFLPSLGLAMRGYDPY
jgi:Tfp pilus assembly PilM family ATPase